MPSHTRRTGQWATANRDARFHPMDEPDSLPCIELAGVLVFAYLDRRRRCLCVSVDLDTAADWLVHNDTVPLQIGIGDTVVADYAEQSHPAGEPMIEQATREDNDA